VRSALASVSLAEYPDPRCTDLRQAIAARLEVPPDWVLVGNGATELIHLLARAVLQPGKTAAIFTPTFSEYEAACLAAGARVLSIQAGPPPQFTWPISRHTSSNQWQETTPSPVEGLSSTLSGAKGKEEGRACTESFRGRTNVVRGGTDLVFLCNPNNPTGLYLPPADVTRIIRAFPGAVIAIDEAYASFADQPWDSIPLVRDFPNVVLIHSMTKLYAIPGLRLGYAIAQPQLLDRLEALQPSWSVNAAALAAGLAALNEDAYVQLARACVQEAKTLLCSKLEPAGLTVTRGAANFIMVDVGNAAEVRRRLLPQRLCVRDCTSFGLPHHIRIGVRTPEECARLADALLAVLATQFPSPKQKGQAEG
jgi:histidinol-phosphate/aromatic aminotransferase/cobyric acid decarboxylase-like protein